MQSSRSSFRRRLQPSRSIPPHNESTRSNQFVLDTNAYSVKTIDNIGIHKYLLTVRLSPDCPSWASQETLLRNHVSRAIRKYIMTSIVTQLVHNRSATNKVVIGWSLDSLFSTEILAVRSSTSSSDGDNYQRREFMFPMQEVWINPTNPLYLDIRIKLMETFLSNSKEHLYELLSSLIHHQLYIKMIKYGAVYFKQPTSMPERRIHLISEQCTGICLSALQACENDSNIVVINAPITYLTYGHRFIDLVASVVYNRSVEGVFVESLSGSVATRRDEQLFNHDLSEDEFEVLKSHLDGYKCHAYIDPNYVEVRCNLSILPASRVEIPMPDQEPKSLLAYYRDIGVNITYPRLPCLETSRGEFIPIELCILEPGQKTPIFRLSRSAAQEMIKLAKQNANKSKISCDKARVDISRINYQQLESFGVSMSQQNIKAIGSSIGKPVLQFQNQNLTPRNDYWESSEFYQAMSLNNDWCVVNAISVDDPNPRVYREVNAKFETDKYRFFVNFANYCRKFGFDIASEPFYFDRNWSDLSEFSQRIASLIQDCQAMTNGNLKLIIFVIGPSVNMATKLNRLIHLTFDDRLNLAATCLRFESITNIKQQGSIFRTLVHKLNARLGGINLTYDRRCMSELNLNPGDLLVIGLDVTHPDNELKGVSIVGCAYSFSHDLFKHKSLVWPQAARSEIIGKIDILMQSILRDYQCHNSGSLPKHIIIYRDGVSHEEFNRVEISEISKIRYVLEQESALSNQSVPYLSFIIAQKRHTMRFYETTINVNRERVYINPPSGTLIDEGVVSKKRSEFYLYSNISNHATARPLHYHILVAGLGIEELQKLTYYLSFNYGKCSGTLSMPSSLRYAHNAAYDARNRVIEAREFSDNKFYTSKYFC